MELLGFLCTCSIIELATSSEHASPWSLDLDRFVGKLLRDQSLYFPDVATAQSAISEYRRFLNLHQKYPEHWVAASKLVDIVWHEHIVDTRRYMADSQRLFGRYLHHTPCFGEGRTFHHQNDMVKAYEETFGEFPREDIWGIPQLKADFPGCKTFPTPPGPPAPCPPPPPPVQVKLQISEGKKEELCIDGGTDLSAKVTLQKCNSSAYASQGFDGTYADLSIGDRNFPYLEEGRCVELVNGDTTNGNHFTMECCKEREAPGGLAKQKFHLNSTSGKIYYGAYGIPSTKCIYAKTKQAGETLVIWDCEDVDGQKWASSWRSSYINATAVI